MPITADKILAVCRLLKGIDSPPRHSLAEYLAAIPRLDSLDKLPSGTPVLVRGDLDAKPGPAIGDEDIRLRSMVDTLQYGRDRGWKQILFGHIGRKPEGSLDKVAKRLGELLAMNVPLVDNWLDESSLTISPDVTSTIAAAAPGSVLMLQNTRKYAIETVLWKAKPDALPQIAEQLARLTGEFEKRVAKHYVNEALSAGSLDTSSTIIPLGMERAVLGKYVRHEFEGPMARCLKTELVVFSGLKIDKLDDLQAMIDRGTIRWVIAAGSLAMALKKAAVELDGGSFGLGVAEDPAHADKPYYIPPERIEQARRMIAAGREHKIEFVLPVDFVLADGRVSSTIGPGEQQFDVGPKTCELFAAKVGEFIAAGPKGRVAFHNGVFGMFEDPRFENGTKQFMLQLKRMKDAGIEVYIGGGEGGAALERYGKPDWVTHVFTAGGTVLNALGSEPVPYLLALSLAAGK